MTLYRLAASARDYVHAHDLIKAEGLEQARLSFPTVMAWKDNELTGLLSTQTDQKAIIAGPLVIKSGQRRHWTLIRLIENYERVMREMQIKSFIFSVDKDSKTWLDKINDVWKIEPYTEFNGRFWYQRNL